MSVVGRAYVTVRAVTRQVPDDIKRGVEGALNNFDSERAGEKYGSQVSESISKGMEKDESVDRASENMGGRISAGMSRGIEGDDSVEKSVDKKVSEAIDKTVVKSETEHRDEFSKLGWNLGGAMGDGFFSSRGLFQKKIKETIKPDRGTDRDVGWTFGRAIAVQLAAGFISSIPKMLLSSWILPAVQQGIPAVSALSAATVGLASTLGPVLAAGAAVGGSAIFGLITTMGTLTAAFKVNKDNVAELASSLGPVRDEWRRIISGIQGELFPVLATVATRVTDALGPTLGHGMFLTAQAVDNVAISFMRLAQSTQFQQDLAVVMRSNASAMQDFGNAGVRSVGILASLGAAAAPLTTRFSGWVDQQVRGIQASVELGRQTGALSAFFVRAGDTTAEWGRILGNTTAALFHIFQAGSQAGGGFLDSLDKITKQFNDWTTSLSGQNALADWFASAQPVLRDFGNMIPALITGLNNWSGSGQTLHTTLVAITSVLPAVGTILGALSSSVGDLATAIGPTINEIAKLAPAWSDASRAIAGQIGPALHNVTPALLDAARAALALVKALAPSIGVLSRVAQVGLGVLAPALRGLAVILDHLPHSVTGVIGAVLLLRLAFNKLSSSERLGPMMQNLSNRFSTYKNGINEAAGATNKFKAAGSGLVDALGGPWMIALTAAVAVIGKFAQESADSKARVEEYTGTLNRQTGALTNNTRAQVANNLEKNGALEAAQRLGISMQDITDAAMGNQGAIDRVNAKLKDTATVGGQLTHLNWKDIGAIPTGGATQFEKDMVNVKTSVAGTNDELDKSQGAWARHQAAMQHDGDTATVTGHAFRSVQAQLAAHGRGLDGVSTAANGASRAEQRLTNSIFSYRSEVSKAIGSTINFKQAIDDARKQINQSTHTLNLNKQAGRENMKALLGVADAAGSVTGSAKKQQAALADARGVIIRFAQAAGDTRAQAERLADRLIGVHSAASGITKGSPYNARVDVDTAGATHKLTSYQNLLNGVVKVLGTTIPAPNLPPIPHHRAGNQAAANAGGSGRGLGRAGTSGPAPVMQVTQGSPITNIYYVTVNNPTKERGSDSIPRALRRTRDLGIGADG